MTSDNVVSLHPYFKVHSGKMDAFRGLVKRFVEATKSETGCLYYAFTFNGDVAYCREGYVDAAALLHHGENVGALIQEALTIADLLRMEVHGPAGELEKLREMLTPMNAEFFTLDHGIRK